MKNDNHKLTSGKCHYCDYNLCRKGHKCKWYKKEVKKGNEHHGRENNGIQNETP